jgi:glyoxylase-like metal-dependent hydrolase (beta-lactamase superfamily II)
MRINEHLYFYRGVERLFPAFGLYSGNSSIISGEGLTLIDPGTSPGFHLRSVREQSARDGLRFGDINKILLTHAHQDHAPAAPFLADELGADILCHELEIPMLEDQKVFFLDEYNAFKPSKNGLPYPPEWIMEAGSYLLFGAVKPVTGAVAVREGTVIDEAAGATVVELPGHRPGEIGIYISEDRALITGDIINWRRYKLPSLNMPVSDLDMTVSSLKKIQSMNVEVIVNGHECFIRGESRIKKWVAAVLDWCDWARETATRETDANPCIPLLKLGKILIGNTVEVPPYEIIPIAHTVLKSIGFAGESPLFF